MQRAIESLNIRQATIDDARAIARVHVRTWQTAYRGIVADEYLASLSEADRTIKWAEILTQPATFVAEAGEVVGFANGRKGNGSELCAIYVLPEWHGKGIGRRLLARFAQWAEPPMTVWVLGANPSRCFYERLGGKLVDKKDVRIGSQTLEEVAYEWSDLTQFDGR